ncbi:hypothetical protein CC1G_10608 [Coprinopsis cinerea okayama7|uniref:Uncharacterized protein n=1 Tax=Coprinopsis cinerea (strain Okayama-7 / 130 / ATCC MYA-4618 / FGSC 9003) TaxID=240176 RepID=A8P8Q5_COPC7|nr:hypothetical protein CC1G_10608 [Coprinopsis cinerea okayama7\|eukprot:XP_001839615.1 hypothetical protein CC1G_10608 [Coprinopsis cinerea okayama7\
MSTSFDPPPSSTSLLLWESASLAALKAKQHRKWVLPAVFITAAIILVLATIWIMWKGWPCRRKKPSKGNSEAEKGGVGGGWGDEAPRPVDIEALRDGGERVDESRRRRELQRAREKERRRSERRSRKGKERDVPVEKEYELRRKDGDVLDQSEPETEIDPFKSRSDVRVNEGEEGKAGERGDRNLGFESMSNGSRSRRPSLSASRSSSPDGRSGGSAAHGDTQRS